MRCESCGSKFSSHLEHCPKCGAKIDSTSKMLRRSQAVKPQLKGFIGLILVGVVMMIMGALLEAPGLSWSGFALIIFSLALGAWGLMTVRRKR